MAKSVYWMDSYDLSEFIISFGILAILPFNHQQTRTRGDLSSPTAAVKLETPVPLDDTILRETWPITTKFLMFVVVSYDFFA